MDKWSACERQRYHANKIKGLSKLCFLSLGREAEGNISHTRPFVVSPRFSNESSTNEKDAWGCKCGCVKTSSIEKQLTSVCRACLKNVACLSFLHEQRWYYVNYAAYVELLTSKSRCFRKLREHITFQRSFGFHLFQRGIASASPKAHVRHDCFQPIILGSFSKYDVDESENVKWKCDFAFLQLFVNYSNSLFLKNVF